MPMNSVFECSLSSLIKVKPSAHNVIEAYLEQLKEMDPLKSQVKVSRSGNIWTIRYHNTGIWIKLVKQMVLLMKIPQIAIVDCGYQFGRIINSQQASLVEWEEEDQWRKEYDKPIGCVIYSNFGILGLGEAEKKAIHNKMEHLFETVIIGLLDLSK